MSSCVSYKVGCVFVKDGRILSTGYNGTPAGYKFNCDKMFPNYNPETDREKHKEFSSMYEIHSEINAILFAAKNGIKLEGSSVYCTVEPCKDCLKAIIQLGVKKIIFLNYYDGNDSIRELQIKFCKDNGVMFGKFDSGSKKTKWL
jgi:dCMP deaminase